MTTGIYVIRNLKNGRVYIGSGLSIERRWASHKHHLARRNHHSRHLQNAWNKYGAHNFAFEIVELVLDASLLIEREQYWIDHLDVITSGYNIHPQARSPLGVKRSDLTRAKLRQVKRPWNSDRNRTPKMRALSSARAIARNQTEAMRMAVSKAAPARTGWHHTDEAKAKMSAAKKGKMPYPVVRGPKGIFTPVG